MLNHPFLFWPAARYNYRRPRRWIGLAFIVGLLAVEAVVCGASGQMATRRVLTESEIRRAMDICRRAINMENVLHPYYRGYEGPCRTISERMDTEIQTLIEGDKRWLEELADKLK